MAISWSVADVLRAPARHAGDALAVTGVLYLDEQLAFRIFESADDGYDERSVVDIDDHEAAVKLRNALLEAGEDPVYLGPAVVDGQGRIVDEILVLENIFTIYLGDPSARARDVARLDVRPNPWSR